MESVLYTSVTALRMTDAYGASTLRVPHAPSDLSDSSDLSDKIAQEVRRTPEGCPFFSPDVEGRSPEDSGLRWGSIPATPLGCRTDCLTGKCDTLAGSYILKSVFFPGVFATSWLDTRAKKR